MRVEGFSKISATLAAGERARGQRGGLQLERAVEQRVELGRAQLRAGEEVAWSSWERQSRRCVAWTAFLAAAPRSWDLEQPAVCEMPLI